MTEYIVYCHTLFDGRKYFGATSQPTSRRWRNDGSGYQGNNRFYKAIQQYGWDSFKHEIIKTNLSKEHADELEMSLIDKYKTRNPRYGFNEHCGGHHVWHNPTDEQKKILSERNKHNFLGRKHTEETKKKLSEQKKGAKNPNANGKLLTPERIKQFTEYAKKPKTDIQKQRMSQSAKKCSVICEETGEVFSSMKEAAEIKEIRYATLSSAIYRGKMVRGYHWKKFDEIKEE